MLGGEHDSKGKDLDGKTSLDCIVIQRERIFVNNLPTHLPVAIRDPLPFGDVPQGLREHGKHMARGPRGSLNLHGSDMVITWNGH